MRKKIHKAYEWYNGLPELLRWFVGYTVLATTWLIFSCLWQAMWGQSPDWTSVVSMLVFLCIGQLVTLRLQTKRIENMLRSGAINEIVARLADGRTIYISDKQNLFEAPPRSDLPG